MKKVKFTGKLSLNKETIAQLNEDQMNIIKGGVCTYVGSGCSGIGYPCLGTRVSLTCICNNTIVPCQQ